MNTTKLSKSAGTTAILYGALLFPNIAHASTKDGALAYAIGVGFFALIMGIAAATRDVTKNWSRTGIFFASAGICVIVSWMFLMMSWENGSPFATLLLDALLFAALVVPVPFLASFTLFMVIGLFTDRKDQPDQKQ